MAITKQEDSDLLSAEPEENANMGIVVSAEKIKAWSTTTSGVRA
jgi:hypothetical protein